MQDIPVSTAGIDSFEVSNDGMFLNVGHQTNNYLASY